MNFLDLAKERYSCRKFSNKEVEQEKIDKIIECAMSAPTAVNKQPFKIWVLKEPQISEKLIYATPFTFNASVVLAIGANPENSYVRKYDNKNFSEIDATIVATHMMLEIQSLGLGTTWVGHFDPKKLKELFPEMEKYKIVALFPTGYPAEDVTVSEFHYKSKTKDELASMTYSK